MPGSIPFLEFLAERGDASVADLERDFELGCLLDLANPTRSSQKTARVVPLLRNDGRRSRVVLGRDPAACDIVVGGPTVSRRHACFELQAGKVVVIDLGSVAGTHVGSRQLEPMQALALPTDALSELWFGDEAFFHFGPRALHDYLRHLQASTPSGNRALVAAGQPAPSAATARLEPSPSGERPSGRIPSMPHPTQRLKRVGAHSPPSAADEAKRAEAWKRGMAAIVQLAPTARTIELQLLIDEAPITVYDADVDPALPRALQVLEGLRSGVRKVQVNLRRSGFPIVVYERPR